MPDNKDTIDDLSHTIIESKIDVVHQRIDAGEKLNTIEFAHIKEGIDQVLAITKETFNQTKETNGRVTELEKKKIKEELEKEINDKKLEAIYKHTRAVRFLHKYPIVTTGFILVGYLWTMPGIRATTIESIKQFFGLFSKIF